MNAVLSPLPGSTPLAEEYRRYVAAIDRTPPSLDGFRASDFDPISITAARARWKKRMVDEYRSTTVFSGLSAQLVEANASLDTNVIVLRMAQDEFRHAEVCADVVSAMGGVPRATLNLEVQPLARHPGCSARERALRNVLVTSVSEMHSIAYFVASLDQMACPILRRVTRALLTDEILHGRFGLYYLQACDWLADDAAVRASISEYLRHVFARCEGAFLRESEEPIGADARALGIVPDDVARDVFVSTMERAVVPAFDSFGLDASGAWKRRSSARRN